MKIKMLCICLVLALLLAGCGSGQQEIEGGLTCTLEVRCDSLLPNLGKMESGKTALVPEDGIIPI